MIEFWRPAIRRQFHAAIDMLGNAMEACPGTVWFGRERGAFWYLSFHVLFFLDLYLSSEDESRFRPPAPFGLSELDDEVVVPEPPLPKGRTARLPRALPEEVGRCVGGNDGSLGFGTLSFRVSRDEQWGIAAL